MYNYQTFLREQNLNKRCSAIKKQYLHAQMKRQHSTPALAHNHKKRVEGFIIAAIDKPIPVSQYRNEPPCFRQTSTDGLLGIKGIYIRRESQSQRIESSLKSNSELDQVPFNNTFSHQFRESSDKGFKYKPFTQSLRLKEFLDKQSLNYLPNASQKPDKLVKKAIKGEHVQLRSLNKSIHKTLLPVLHAKTYFKSVSTLFSEIPQGAKNQTYSLIEEGGEEGEVQLKRTLKPKDHLSRKQNSRQALIKCNMLPLRA